MEEDKNNLCFGTVLEALPNAMFKVELEEDKVVLAYLSGKMRIHHIKVLIGDRVSLEMDDYGEKGRIMKRM